MVQGLNASRLYRALTDFARRYQFRNRDEVCCYGLTISQCYALELLAWEGVLASSALASRLGLDISSTTRLVDQLVRKKLAVRRRMARDARVREIEITDPGRRLVARIEEDFSTMLADALRDMPPAVLKALPEIIRRLTATLGGSDAEACRCGPASAQAEDGRA
ncbi:MAG: MarR family transcriptional regulator [Acidobacteriota bacterium]